MYDVFVYLKGATSLSAIRLGVILVWTLITAPVGELCCRA